MIQKKFRLGKEDVSWVLSKGNQIITDLFIVRFLKENLKPHSKFTVITSLKLAKKAVERNRIKRKIYEAIRLNIPKDLAYKIVIIPKKRIIESEYKEIDKEIKILFSKLTTKITQNG
jgi:ribonuclease P protein component